MATISQAQHRRKHDRHSRWTRLARADLLARDSALHTQGLAQRPAAKVREGPRTPLQVWRAYHEPLAERPTVVACLHSVPGLACLQRWGIAFQVGYVALGACGLRLVCLGLEWPGRKRFGGTSYGPQPQVNRHVAEASVAYRQEERTRRSHEMPRKDSTLTPDATFTGGLCLVGIAPVSNAMVLAQAAQARAHAPWQACLELALVGRTWQGLQAPSDEAPSLLWRLWHSPSGRLTRRTSSLGSCGRTPRRPLLEAPSPTRARPSQTARVSDREAPLLSHAGRRHNGGRAVLRAEAAVDVCRAPGVSRAPPGSPQSAATSLGIG